MLRLSIYLALTLLGVFCSLQAGVPKTVVYKEYFHSKAKDSVMAAWKSNKGATHIARSPRGINLLGVFSGTDSINLSVPSLSQHHRIQIEVVFHIIGSWDGVVDDDRFIMHVDKHPVIDATFSNTTSKQSWPGVAPNMLYPPRATARNSNMLAFPSRIEGVYIGPMDATYKQVIDVAHNAPSVSVSFSAHVNNVASGLEFKGWGLESVVVTAVDTTVVDTTPIPEETDQDYALAEIRNYEGKDIRELAEFTQDEDFPGLRAGSEFERSLHINIIGMECHSCGDFCLWYTLHFYTDGWVNVWTNKSAGGTALFATTLKPTELDSVRTMLDACLEEKLEREYHDAAYEEAHPDVTHCTLALSSGRRGAETEVYAAEPVALRQLMTYLMDLLSRYGWTPLPG